MIAILDPDGTVIAGDPLPFDPPRGWSVARDAEAPETAYRVIRTDLAGRSLTVAIQTGSADRAVASLTKSTAWAAVAALIVALFGGGWIAGRIRTRQTELQSVLDRIGAGDLSARLPLTARDDDMNDLARGANAAFARLEAAVQAMRHASDDIAHDLRTPLSRLRLLAVDLQEELDQTAPATETVARMIDEIDGTGTFTALLRISQIEAGARRGRLGEMDLRPVVEAVAETYEVVAEESGRRFSTALPVGPVTIRWDHDLLVQSLVNLIENAIRHTPAGSMVRCLVADDPKPSLIVEDDGPGIPGAERDRVLRRLYRLKSSRTTPGSGLGLALVKAVSDLHGTELVLADAGPGLRVAMRFRGDAGANACA